jgi:sporulation integral membrane protein YtvI
MVLDKLFLNKLKNNAIYFGIYTLIFIVLYYTFPYVAPFVIGGVIAFFIKPISKRLKEKYNIDKGISTLILSFLAVIILLALFTIFIVNGIKQTLYIISVLSLDSQSIYNNIMKLIDQANIYIGYVQNIGGFGIESIITKYSNNIVNFARSILENVLALVVSIPYIVVYTITIFVATYFIAKDTDDIEEWFYCMFSSHLRPKVKGIKHEVGVTTLGYIKAYSILMGITFLATWIGFTTLGVPYGFILGVIGASLDLIPFLGLVIIYIPVIAYYLIINNYFVGISVIILFAVLSISRQILEPKLVSITIGIAPLASLAAIFIGVQVYGVLGIFYFLGLVGMHKILSKSGVL